MTDVAAIAAIRTQLQSSRQAAIAQYRQALRPDTLLAALCHCADQTLRALLEQLGAMAAVSSIRFRMSTY